MACPGFSYQRPECALAVKRRVWMAHALQAFFVVLRQPIRTVVFPACLNGGLRRVVKRWMAAHSHTILNDIGRS